MVASLFVPAPAASPPPPPSGKYPNVLRERGKDDTVAASEAEAIVGRASEKRERERGGTMKTKHRASGGRREEGKIPEQASNITAGETRRPLRGGGGREKGMHCC